MELAVKGYTGGIAIVAASLTVYKMAECLSDVFEGLYQQKFRFDVSGKSQFVKDLTMIIVYIGMLVITRDVVISSVVLAAVSILLIVVIDFPLTKYFGRLGVHFNMKAVKGLTIACFALFVSSFLCAYIHSAPGAAKARAKVNQAKTASELKTTMKEILLGVETTGAGAVFLP